jgi:hypothetical protein
MCKPRRFHAFAFLGCLVFATNVGAAETIGNLSTDHAVTVTSQGLDVKIQPGQDYVVFSGDRIASRPGDGTALLGIPDAGNLKLSPDTAMSVERSDGRYDLRVERGELGFELIPGSKMVLVSGGELFELGEGTGKGGISISADGSEGYLVLVKTSGGIRVISLVTGDLVYEGEATPGLTYAQVGAAPPAAGGAGLGGVGATGGTLGGLALGAGSVPFFAGAVTAALAAVDTNPAVFRERRGPPDVPPASPVRPPGPPFTPPGPPFRPPGPPVTP